MTASATAARLTTSMPPVGGLMLVVVGGLIEGIALGILQGRFLARRFPGLSRIGWIVTTVVVAGIGWSLASAPAALAESDGAPPPQYLILLGAAGLGVAMGALMGVAQALVFRGHVSHPWRWVPISVGAWTPTMVVIFVGATLPDASWSTPSVIATGLATGLAAGAVLGSVSGVLLHLVDGVSKLSRTTLQSSLGGKK